MPQSPSWMVGLQWDALISEGRMAGIPIGQAPFTQEHSSQSWLLELIDRMRFSDAASMTSAPFDASAYRANQVRPTWGGLMQTRLRL